MPRELAAAEVDGEAEDAGAMKGDGAIDDVDDAVAMTTFMDIKTISVIH